MNFRFVINQIALLVSVLSAILLAIGAWSALLVFAFDDDTERHASLAFIITGAVGLAIGMAGWLTTRRCKRDFERREALLLVALSWILGAALAGAPYLLWASMAPPTIGAGAHIAFASPVNCYFEAMSGLTTTGATVLTGLDEIPRSIHLWRAATHWLGGLGIVVLFVAVLPSLGVAGKRMFSVEAAGPNPRGVRPEIRETARMLWLIYLGLTGAEIHTQLSAGKSLGEIAAATAGKTREGLIAGLVQAHNALIDQAVTDGKLTAAQATERKGQVTSRVTEMVDRKGGATGGPKEGGRRGPGGHRPGQAPATN
jgi:trk system potassium uptake protein TrkH